MTKLPKKLIFRTLALCIILTAAYFLNQRGMAGRLLAWAEGLGPWAPLLFTLLSIPATLFFVPSAVLTFTAGILFGLGRGFLIGLVGTSLGAVAALLMGRYLARDWIAKRFSQNKKFRLLEEIVRRKGWKIVSLARLSPVFPFLVGNYLFGLTSVPAKNYFAASLVGSVPSVAVYVYLGTLGRDLVLGEGAGARTPAQWALFFAGLAATVVLTLYFRRVARQALENQDE